VNWTQKCFSWCSNDVLELAEVFILMRTSPWWDRLRGENFILKHFQKHLEQFVRMDLTSLTVAVLWSAWFKLKMLVPYCHWKNHELEINYLSKRLRWCQWLKVSYNFRMLPYVSSKLFGIGDIFWSLIINKIRLQHQSQTSL